MPAHAITVLMIEDNPIHARLIQNLMDASDLTYDLLTADSLAKGIERLDQGKIDVVLLDLVLPDSAEIATLESVRAAAPDIPIIVLTSLDDVSLAAKAVEAGAQDYLIKTDVNSMLLARSIHYAIERFRALSGEWDAPMFRLAQQQFLKAAQIMGLDDNIDLANTEESGVEPEADAEVGSDDAAVRDHLGHAGGAGQDHISPVSPGIPMMALVNDKCFTQARHVNFICTQKIDGLNRSLTGIIKNSSDVIPTVMRQHMEVQARDPSSCRM